MKEDNQSPLSNLLNDSSFKNWATKSNKNDIVFWNSWIKNNPDKIETAYAAKAIILGISFNKNTLAEDTVNEKLDLVLKRIQKDGTVQIDKPKKNFGWSVKGLAAVAAIGLVLAVLTFNMFDATGEVVHRTGFGEMMNLKLSDGTSVVLNGNSEIRYNSETPRNVDLKGEAYFKVAPKLSTHAKFWVNTEDLRIEVYGTQFHVNAHDDKTNVALDEGSINLLLKNGVSQKMVPGELVSYSGKSDTILHEKVNKALNYALWREGTYTFNNVSLLDVMKYIEHTYGVSSEFMEKSLEAKTITGGIPNENLEICLMAIQKATGTRIVQEDNKLLIFNK